MRCLAPLLAALLLWPGHPALAQDAELFDRLDRDRDGRLTRDELQSSTAQRGNWIAVDRDGDGVIRRDEFGTVPVARSAGDRGAAAGGTQPPAPAKR